MRGETPIVVYGIVAGLGYLYKSNPKRRVWPSLKVASPLECVNLKLFLQILDNTTDSGHWKKILLNILLYLFKETPNVTEYYVLFKENEHQIHMD